MLDILAKWNRWGSAKLDAGSPRDITQKIQPLIKRKETIALIGPRRAGKSTVLYQLMDDLESQSVPKEACLHINFEEPKLSPYLKPELLDHLYEVYRQAVYPKGKAYIFLDEIQNVPQWEKWVRARNETEDIKVFITGSSAKLLSQELATVLTGRHFSFSVYPLSFKEFLRFKGVEIPSTLLTINPIPEIQYALNTYITWGGLPEVVLADNNDEREYLLKQYFDDLLFKDISLRYAVRDTQTLRSMAIYLLTQTASLVSFQRLSKQFDVSLDLVKAYSQYLQNSYLIKALPYFSLKAAERTRRPQKIHAVDLGFREIAKISATADKGRTIETMVHNHLYQQKNESLYYWKGVNEIGLLVNGGSQISQLVQVVFDGLDDAKTRHRELSALEEVGRKFPQAEQCIVTTRLPKIKLDKKITLLPLWMYLLQ